MKHNKPKKSSRQTKTRAKKQASMMVENKAEHIAFSKPETGNKGPESRK